MHNTCWDMFVEERDKGTRLLVETYEAVFDSCVSHARISRIVEVGQTMEAMQAPARSIKPKRLEHLRRARMVLNIHAPAGGVGAVSGGSPSSGSKGARGAAGKKGVGGVGLKERHESEGKRKGQGARGGNQGGMAGAGNRAGGGSVESGGGFGVGADHHGGGFGDGGGGEGREREGVIDWDEDGIYSPDESPRRLVLITSSVNRCMRAFIFTFVLIEFPDLATLAYARGQSTINNFHDRTS